jgi:hypothetical protein
MSRSFAKLMFGGALAAQLLTAGAKAQQAASAQPSRDDESASVKYPTMPAAPLGKSTIMGGEIQNLDSVRDQFQLRSFGQKPMTIVFDERTEVYLDGKKIRLRDLRSNSRASIQTVLDGTNVFAISIHLLSRLPEGEFQGRVLSYSPNTGELIVSAASSRDPVKLIVPMNTQVTHLGQGEWHAAQSGPSDLVRGALLTLTFEPDNMGRGIAKQIEVLATPGSAFVFGGTLSSLDVHAGLMTVIDPRDEKSYQLVFDASKVQASQALHEGDSVRVTATYDGSRYVVNSISSN